MSDAPPIPADLRAWLAEIGPRWLDDTAGNVGAVTERFSALHRAAPRPPLRETLDLPYGPHERHRLDVHAPRTPGPPAPAVIFVHGGGFTDGHRNRTPEIYANVARYFARHGMVGINIGYRLAPESFFPGGTSDIADAVGWTHANAERLGIDPTRIFLMGHSAGGAHVASYAYDRRFRPADGRFIAGALLISSRVRADNAPDNTNARRVEAYYGTDASVFDDVSGVSHVDAHAPPSFVAWSEFENKLIDMYSAELVYRLAQVRRRTPPMLYLPGHNHTSIIAHIDTAEDALGAAMRDFIADPR